MEVEFVFSNDLHLGLGHCLLVSLGWFYIDSPRCRRVHLMTSQVPFLLHVKKVRKGKLALHWEAMHYL